MISGEHTMHVTLNNIEKIRIPVRYFIHNVAFFTFSALQQTLAVAFGKHMQCIDLLE